MFKITKHIFLFIAFVALTLITSACKGRKTASASKENIPSTNANSFDAKQAEFTALFIDGCSQRIKGNLQDALKNFEECKKMQPLDASVRYELGMLYKLLGNSVEAIENAKFCANAQPKNEWYQLLLIENYLQAKDYTQAIKVRETLVKNFPSRNDFKEDLAIEYSLTGQYEKAFKLYNELEKTYGVNEQLTLNKVKLLKSQQKYKECEEELIRLCQANKSEIRFHAYLADFYMDRGALEKAKAEYDKVLLLDPANPLVNLAMFDYYNAKGQSDEAFEYIKKAFNNPDFSVVEKASILSEFYKNAELGSKPDFEKGIQLARINVLVHPQATESNGIYGDFLRLGNKSSEAYNYYLIAALNEKRNQRIWRNLLIMEKEQNKYDSLRRHSAMCLEIFPNWPEAYLFNGLANSHLKNYQKSAESLKEGLSLVTDNKLLAFDFLRALGDSYFYLKEYPKSDKAFDEALKIDSDNTYVLNNYAYYLSLRNESLDKAEKLSRKSNELRPNDRAYMDTYGWILYQQKKYTEAEEWLSRAAKTAGNNAVILEHYGDLLFRLNKPDKALEYWNLAKKAGDNTPALLKKIEDKRLSD